MHIPTLFRTKSNVCGLLCILLGFSTFLLWGFLFIHVTGTPEEQPTDVFFSRIVLSLSYFAMMAFAVFFVRFTYPLRVSSSLPCLVLAVVGVLIAGFSSVIPSYASALKLAGTLVVGLEYGWLTLLWGEALGYMDAKHTGFCVVLAFVICAVSYLAVQYCSHEIQVLLSALLPIASTASLWLGIIKLSTGGNLGERKAHPDKFHGLSLRVPWKTSKLFGLVKEATLTTGAFGFIFAATNLCFGRSGYEVMGLGVLGVALAAALLAFSSAKTIKYLYRVSQPAMGLGLALLPANSNLGMLLVFASYSTVLFLTILTLCEVSNKFSISVVKQTAAVFGVNLLFLIAGQVLGVFVSNLLRDSRMESYIISLALLVLLMTYIAIASKDGGYIFNLSTIATDYCERSGTTYKPSTAGPSESELAISTMMFHEAISQRCTVVAGEFDLTPREEEVLIAVSQGMSIAEIAKSFYIAPGTVKTHINHIYKKMSISNRDELKKILNVHE